MKKIIGIFITIILVISSLFGTISVFGVEQEINEPSATTHLPIRINSNSDFTIPNGVNAGTGTSVDPYIIDNWDIDATGYGCGIFVGNTTSHFKITNCEIYSASGNSGVYWHNSGILFYYTDNGTIDNCNIFDNDGYGIHFVQYSDNNNIINTNISNNIYGIKIFFSINNSITNCNIFNNINGVYLSSAFNNNIYHNNFINNPTQAIDSGTNNWNLAYEMGGNYWDDYTGVDLYQGINQDILGSDGIGDTPYIFTGGQDNYPLMEYWENYTFPLTILHIPIRINSDSEFTLTNGVTSGTGTIGDPYIIEDWTIDASGYGCGIFVGNTTSYFTIQNCTVYDASGYSSTNYFYDSGIFLYDVDNGIIENNNILENGMSGIRIILSFNINIIGNNVTKNIDNGIYLITSSNINIISNNVIDNIDYGIYLYNIDNGIIENNNITENFAGIYLYTSSNYNITGNNVSGNTNYGIYLYISSNYNNITGNIVTGIIYGIYLHLSSNNNIVNNNVSENSYGIYIFSSSNNNVIGNVINNTAFGIYLYTSSNYNNITGNNVSGNTNYGIYVFTSSYNHIYNNNLMGNTIHAYDDSTNHWNSTYQFGGNYWDDYSGVDNYRGVNQDILGSDGIGDTPYIFTGGQDNYPLMEYWENYTFPLTILHIPIRINSDSEFTLTNGVTSGTGTIGDPYIIEDWTIDATGYGCGIYIGNTTAHFIISNCIIHDASGIFVKYYYNMGIYIYNSNGGEINNNRIYDCDQSAIYNIDNSNVIIQNNNITDCGYGVHLYQSDNVAIKNNTIMNISNYGIYSIISDYTNISNNTFINNFMGIYLQGSWYGDIIENSMYHGTYGIYSISSNYNHIYHNNFIGYTNQVYDDSTNYWNSTYQYGGNYWDNYVGVDLYHGINQDILGSDGFGDTPYVFTSGQDYYPLMDYWQNYTFQITIPHLPIRINSDSGFNVTNGVTSGTGISGDPYIIENWNIDASGYGCGIYVGNTTKHFVIRNCSVYDASGYPSTNYYYNSGIFLHIINNGIIENNYINNNRYGIYLQVSSNNNITNNNVSENIYGIGLSSLSNYNNITGNNASENNYGIHLLTLCNYNNITDNIISGNDCGICLLLSDYNNIYHNNFIGNTNHMTDNNNNYWNSTYQFGGNYYDDYTGIDLYHGVNQDILDSDNIGDTPYIFTTGQDNYPLMYPFETNNTPVADAGVDQTLGASIHINGMNSSDAGGTSLNWSWTFTYNTIPYTFWGESFYFDFILLDNYIITLKVTDDCGNYDIDTMIVSDNSLPPIADAGTDITDKRDISLDGSGSYDSDGIIMNWTWEFTYNENPILIYGENPLFDFNISGAYIITLTVTDDSELQDTDIVIVNVNILLPIADADYLPTGTNKGIYNFDGSGSYDSDGTITNYTWTFTYNGNSINLYGISPSYDFQLVGTYIIILTVTDDDWRTSTDTTTIEITLINPVADAGIDVVGRVISSLDGSGSTDLDGIIVDYDWSFTYDSVLVHIYGETPSFDFIILGTYIVTLTVTDDDGLTDTDTVTVEIVLLPPVADADYLPTGTQKGIYYFDGTNSIDPDGTITNYKWEFTYDNSIINLYGDNPSFDFQLAGAYTITLTVTDNDALTDTTSFIIQIIYVPPVADAGEDFSYVTNGQSNETENVTLNGSASYDIDGTIVNYTWSYVYYNVTYYLYGETSNLVIFTNESYVYEITLNITDDNGLTSGCIVVIEVFTPIDISVLWIQMLIVLTIIIFVISLIIGLFKKIENPLDGMKQPKQRKINKKGKEV